MERRPNLMTQKELKSTDSPKLTILEAAGIMDVTPRFLQLALQQNKFPFGTAVEGDRWVYYINTERFIKYMKGEDMSEAI
jgi:hypothetical protein